MAHRFGNTGRPSTTVLMVAEKPSASRAITYHFPNKKSRVETRAVFPADRPHSEDVKPFIVREFKALWKTEIVDFNIVSTLGHVSGYDFNEYKYGSRKTSGVKGELFSAAKVYKSPQTRDQERLVAFLKHEWEGCTDLILWLDCDRAGECICLEILDEIRLEPDNPRVHRARFFGLTKYDIGKAMAHLGKINMVDALAIDCFQLADLRSGCSFTRYLTNLLETQLDCEVEYVSFGPCQTPALAFVVDQYKKFKSGKVERYYVLSCHAKVPGSNGKIVFKTVKRFNSKENAESVATQLRSVLGPAPSRQVCVTEENRTEKKPAALITYELMRVASNDLNMLPHNCMMAAERLYTKGKISYPRTNETVYPDTYFKKEVSYPSNSYMEEVLNSLGRDKELEPVIKQLKPLIEFDPTDSIKMAEDGTLPPIIPLEPIEPWDVNAAGYAYFGPITQEDDKAQQLFRPVFNTFAASLSKDCQYTEKTGRFKIGDYEFAAVENVITEKGFTEFAPSKTIKEECIGLKNGQEVKILNIFVEEVRAPPRLLSVAELVTQMEQHRIGTNGSTATHIENLIRRRFMEVTEDQRLRPTDLGIGLIKLFRKHAPKLINPELRRKMEESMSSIKTEGQFPLILNEWVEKYKEEFDRFMEKLEEESEKSGGAAILPAIPLPPRPGNFNGKVKF